MRNQTCPDKLDLNQTGPNSPALKQGGASVVEMADYITVGFAHQRNVIPYMPDMDWLGAPPSKAIADRYEVARVINHRMALIDYRKRLEVEAEELARTFTESPKHRKRIGSRLNQIQVELNAKCDCDICKNGDP